MYTTVHMVRLVQIGWTDEQGQRMCSKVFGIGRTETIVILNEVCYKKADIAS